MICALPAILTVLSLEPVAPPAVELHRSDLANGIRLAVAHVPGAQRQTMFTFLPLTMVSDDANRAQWSHLLEHMLLRSTDPGTLMPQGMQINGETTHMYLRLETFAEPAQWKSALEKHGKWLTARQFDAATLEREKQMIAGEEQSTAANGYTSKFALAAWNQIVVHGLKHAAVHGDVAGASIDRVQQYAAEHVPVDSSVTIATIGPAAVEEARNEIKRVFDALPKSDAKRQADVDQQVDWSGHFGATWDLPTRHAMWWWPLPDDESVQARAAASAIAQAVNIQLFSLDRQLIRSALAYPTVRAGRTPILMIDCCIGDATKPEEIWTLLRPMIGNLAIDTPGHRTVAWQGQMLQQSLMVDAPMELIRGQIPDHMVHVAERVWLLGLMNYEYPWSAPATECADALTQLDQGAVKAVLEALNAAPGTLVLEPAKPQADEAPAR